MARTKPGVKKEVHEPIVPDSAPVRELRFACKANDSLRVRELLDNSCITAEDATACLEDAHSNLSLMRLLLEHGADPAVFARRHYMSRSFDLVKLLVEFGYDISINGHLVLQSTGWLLDHGVDINQTDTIRTDDGSRPGQCLDFSLKHLNIVAAAGEIAFFDHLVARGADPHRSMSLHCASKCKDPAKTIAMIEHLLDVHNINIEANNADLRDFFHASGDTGTPLNCAVYYHNLPAVRILFQRGANPAVAISSTIKDIITEPWLPALSPLLEAGADPSRAFEVAVDGLNFEAARTCLEKGADPTLVLQKQLRKAELKAAGHFDRQRDEDDGDGGCSTDDDEERATKRKKMRMFVSSTASDHVEQAELYQQSRL